MKTFAIETIKRNFPNQWLLIEVAETKDGAPSKGVVLKTSNRREEIVEEIGKNRGKELFFSLAELPRHPIRPSPFSSHLPAEGLLGASFLRHFLVSMDYEKGKLELTTR